VSGQIFFALERVKVEDADEDDLIEPWVVYRPFYLRNIGF
jgi:hypothetical protein